MLQIPLLLAVATQESVTDEGFFMPTEWAAAAMKSAHVDVIRRLPNFHWEETMLLFQHSARGLDGEPEVRSSFVVETASQVLSSQQLTSQIFMLGGQPERVLGRSFLSWIGTDQNRNSFQGLVNMQRTFSIVALPMYFLPRSNSSSGRGGLQLPANVYLPWEPAPQDVERNKMQLFWPNQISQ